MAAVSRNAKTGLLLASIALAWFLGVIVKYWIMGG
jgi:hypothetical protein